MEGLGNAAGIGSSCGGLRIMGAPAAWWLNSKRRARRSTDSTFAMFPSAVASCLPGSLGRPITMYSVLVLLMKSPTDRAYCSTVVRRICALVMLSVSKAMSSAKSRSARWRLDVFLAFFFG